MDDKYNKFKKWFEELEKIPQKIELQDVGCSTSLFTPIYTKSVIDKKRIFEKFEKELEEMEREEKVKKILKKYFIKIEVDGWNLSNNNIDKCYEELRIEGLLK